MLERPKLSKVRKVSLVLRASASARFGFGLPALPGPSQWIVNPEPDPDAEKFPRVEEVAP